MPELAEPHRQRAPRAGRRDGAARRSCSASTRPSSSARSGARSRSARSRSPSTRCMRAAGLPLLPRRQPRPGGGRLGAAPGRGGPGARGGAVPRGTCWSRAARPGRISSFEDRIARASARLEAAPTSRDDVAFWLYSSGSTGPPQGRRPPAPRHGGLRRDLRAAGARHPADATACFSAAKLFFAYGLGNAVLLPDERRRAERALPAPADARGASSS